MTDTRPWAHNRIFTRAKEVNTSNRFDALINEDSEQGKLDCISRVNGGYSQKHAGR